MDPVTMYHAQLDVTVQVPERQAQILERSDWRRVEPTTEEQAATEAAQPATRTRRI